MILLKTQVGYRGGIKYFAVVHVDCEEVGEIPITKDQSYQDMFFVALRVTIQKLLEGTCRT